MATAAADLEAVRRRLRADTVYWAANCAHIVDKGGVLVPLRANAAQLKFDAALERQRADGKPMRAIILKARKLGFSTWVQAKVLHRITQRPFRRALVVAQDTKTAGELFSIGHRIYNHLPPADDLGIKPPLQNFRRGRLLHFGEPSPAKRARGEVGLDSSLEVDTANEIEAGRGYTYHDLHCSEVAFWPDVAKLTSLLNAVPDEPDTMVVLESTANGTNFFKTLWDRAVAGESEYLPLFFPWHEDPTYRLALTPEQEDEFEVGFGPWGEDEERLVEEFGCDKLQLAWRRRTIVDKCESKLEVFNQEYPATPEEAFRASGKHVFSPVLVSRILDRCKQSDPDWPSEETPGPKCGLFEAGRKIPRQTPSGRVDVPLDPKWKPHEPRRRVSEGRWRVWEWPDTGSTEKGKERPRGRYVVSVDPAEGAETTAGESAFMAVQVVDHRTKRQCAEYRSRDDWDLVLAQAYMAALHWHQAWICVEKTGGYGTAMIQRLRDFGYPAIYRRKQVDNRRPMELHELLGFNTDRSTKPLLEDGVRYLIREMPEVFRSWLLAYEMTTYVKDPKTGKTGPEPDAFSDLLMSFAIGQQVALEVPVPTDTGPINATRRAHFNPITKW
jgi:hypothetical protein